MFATQNQIATVITLPQPKVPKFKGDTMDFNFPYGVRLAHSARSDQQDRQHPVGEARELISGCLHMEPVERYMEARQLLQKSMAIHTKYPQRT